GVVAQQRNERGEQRYQRRNAVVPGHRAHLLVELGAQRHAQRRSFPARRCEAWPIRGQRQERRTVCQPPPPGRTPPPPVQTRHRPATVTAGRSRFLAPALVLGRHHAPLRPGVACSTADHCTTPTSTTAEGTAGCGFWP